MIGASTLLGNEEVIWWISIVYTFPLLIAGTPYDEAITPQLKWNILSLLTVIA